MATATRSRSGSAAAEREHHRTNLWAQAARFVGLYLSPVLGLLVAWILHIWVMGIDLHWGPIDVERRTPAAAPFVAVALITAATIGLSVMGWSMIDHRKTVLRAALAGSIATVGILFAINLGAGPTYWWGPLFIVCCWAVAVVWSINRLDVARNDKTGTESEQGDSLLDKLGISKLTRFKPKVIHDDDGEPVRIEATVQHAPGETVKVVQEGMETIESAAAAPPGMSTAIGDPDRADRSNVTIMLTNPFKKNLPVGPLTAPGGSIADWASVADYADGKPAFVTTAPGKHMPSATSYGLVGMTRSGKTGTETQLLTEWGSRIDWACLYLNQAKGLQDIRPLLPIIEAAVIAEDGEAGLGEYVIALQQAKAIMAYRQQELARFAVSAWSPRCADLNPDRRPTRLGAHGKRMSMEPMPFFTVHVGEADAILNSGRAAEDSVYVASKGLSLGTNTGWSLQRPDWKAMPTGLRANIGLWFVHGMNSTDDEDFILDKAVRDAGASPGKWQQRRPGQHFMTGPGIDESRFPVALKTRFLVGSANDENGRPLDFDTLNDRYMSEMLRRNMASANGMMKLDRGSADATDGWWDAQAAKTVDLRARMLTGAAPASSPQPANPQPRRSSLFAGEDVPQPAGEMDPAEMEEGMNEFDEDAASSVAEVRDEVYGDASEAAAAARMDLTRPAEVPATDADPLADSDEDDKPKASTPEEARAELRRTLVRMLGMPKFADPKVPGTAIVGPSSVLEECGLNSRPWVSEQLTSLMINGGTVEDGVVMERVGKPRDGRYRVRRTDGSDHPE